MHLADLSVFNLLHAQGPTNPLLPRSIMVAQLSLSLHEVGNKHENVDSTILYHLQKLHVDKNCFIIQRQRNL